MSKKFKITLEYDYDTDFTTIKVDEKFKHLPAIHTMDFLKSVCEVLNESYNTTITKQYLFHHTDGFNLFALILNNKDVGEQVMVKQNKQ
ncbi:MAG: hypothetical protein EBU90_26215 [Proteobacteria bacterium]|nr:hypothetical protein [Pseudomonadota bacterium]